MFRLPGKKALLKGGLSQPEVVVMDVTETPIERPKRKQKEFYSGKKKRHTLKSQFCLVHMFVSHSTDNRYNSRLRSVNTGVSFTSFPNWFNFFSVKEITNKDKPSLQGVKSG